MGHSFISLLMAIASVGNLGVGGTGTPAGNTLAYSPAAQLDAGNYGLVAIVCDNVAASDGDNNEISSVTDSVGNVYHKLEEWTNSNASAAAGVTCSLWMTKARVNLTTGGTLTINFANSINERAASFWEFSVAAGKVLEEVGQNHNDTDGSNDFGSLSISGLASNEYLFFRALGKELNTTTAITVTANYTNINGTRSRNNAAAVIIRGEFRIVTATGETSNPGLAEAGDTASVFVALREVDPVEVSNSLRFVTIPIRTG